MLAEYIFLKIIIGTCLVATVNGMLGCFTLLRQQSLIGDALAHATLPGICIFFLILQQKSFLILFGGVLSALFAAGLFFVITHYTHLKKDTALGIILSFFFGTGTYFLSFIQKMPSANKSGIHKLLFGNASAILEYEIITIGIVSCIILFFIVRWWQELYISTFDKEFSSSIGIHTIHVDILFLILLATTITLSLHLVGIVLVSSLLVAAPLAARQWTHKVHIMMILSIIFSCIASFIGTYISASAPHIATGPTIVVIISCITFFSLVFGKEGFIQKYFNKKSMMKQIQEHHMLKNFLLFNERTTNPLKLHDITALAVIGKKSNRSILMSLLHKGYICNPIGNMWGLTQAGLKKVHPYYKEYTHEHVP